MVVGITGSIAAVEDVKLIRELIRHGADVVPVMSREGARIVHPNSIQFASGDNPIRDRIARLELPPPKWPRLLQTPKALSILRTVTDS